MMKQAKIFNGDCVEVMKKCIEDNSIDLVFTSPPYNVGIEYDSYKDNLSIEEYWGWSNEWLEQCYRVMKPDGRIAIVHYISMGTSRYKFSPISMLNQISLRIGFQHHSIVIWADKTISTLTAWGSWMSASSPYINTPYEGILILFKDSWKKKNKGISTIQKDEFIKGCSGVWEIPTHRDKEHPAIFPKKLADRVIDLLTYKGDLVLDLFCGVGTTCLSAVEKGRRTIGIDISPRYCRIAKSRMRVWL